MQKLTEGLTLKDQKEYWWRKLRKVVKEKWETDFQTDHKLRKEDQKQKLMEHYSADQA